jgi:hypothetical protein
MNRHDLGGHAKSEPALVGAGMMGDAPMSSFHHPAKFPSLIDLSMRKLL